jgi:hypothetical protein
MYTFLQTACCSTVVMSDCSVLLQVVYSQNHPHLASSSCVIVSGVCNFLYVLPFICRFSVLLLCFTVSPVHKRTYVTSCTHWIWTVTTISLVPLKSSCESLRRLSWTTGCISRLWLVLLQFSVGHEPFLKGEDFFDFGKLWFSFRCVHSVISVGMKLIMWLFVLYICHKPIICWNLINRFTLSMFNRKVKLRLILNFSQFRVFLL